MKRRMVDKNGVARNLSKEERNMIIELMYTQKEVNYNSLGLASATLSIIPYQRITGNYNLSERICSH